MKQSVIQNDHNHHYQICASNYPITKASQIKVIFFWLFSYFSVEFFELGTELMNAFYNYNENYITQ